MRTMTGFFLLLSMSVAVVAADTRDVYLVPFSHLDLYWAGTREECLSRGNRIIIKAMRMAEKYPQFRFLIEDEVWLANFVETHPASAELDTLKRLIKEGRIEIAPKWAAILQNLPRGEAWVRNIVYGKRYAREVFGVDPLVANLGDLPGYTSQFPQILARSRVPYMVMTRMGPADKSLFYYRAPDGSKALVWNTLKGYGWGTYLTSKRLTGQEKSARFQKDFAEVIKTTASPILMNWGTDLWAPADDLVDTIEEFNRHSAVKMRFATPADFFRTAEKTADIPVTGGEIPHAWWNIFTSIVHDWPPAMAGTDALLTAEKFAAINHALGYAPYPQQDFERLWKNALEAMDHNNFGQGGDIGDARKLEYANMALMRSQQITRDMLRNIAERVNSPFPRGMPIVVFNSLNWKRDDVVRAHVSLYGDASPGDIDDYRKGVRLVDETGASVPFYVEQSGSTVSRSLEIVFVARGVPSVGYKTYFVVPAEKPDIFPNAAEVRLDIETTRNPRVIGADELENEFYRVSIDRATGRVSVFDKELGQVVVRDMEIVASEQRGGNSLALEAPSGRIVVTAVEKVEVEDNNAVETAVRVRGDLGGVPVTQRISLYRGTKRLDLENTVDWTPGHFLRIEQAFPYTQAGARVQYGVPFGSVAGSDFLPKSEPRAGDEIKKEFWSQWRQIQDWVWAGTDDWGVSIGADHQVITLDAGVIKAGMLRGAYQAFGTTRRGKPYLLELPPAGKYVFRYSLTSGKGNWAAAKAYRLGLALNNALIPVSPADDLSQKSLPPTNSFLSVESGSIVITALKKAESGPAIVLRAFDMEGIAAEAPIEFLGRARQVRDLNMLEEETGSAAQQTFKVVPYEIKTVKVETAPEAGGPVARQNVRKKRSAEQ